MRYLEPNNFDIRLILKDSSISILRIKISQIGERASEAIKTKFYVTHYTNIFKWKIVYTHINTYNHKIYLD